MQKEELNALDSLTASYEQDFRKAAKEHLRDYVEAVTTAVPAAGRNFFICPCCKSGSGNNNHFTPAFHLYRAKSGDLHFKCFACGAEGDIFTLAGLLNDTRDFNEERRIVADFLGVDLARRSPLSDLKVSDAKVSGPQGIAESNALRKQAHDYIAYCRSHIGETDYFAERGLTDETVQRFMLGYDPQRRQAVIPFGSSYYMGRSTRVGADQKGDRKHYKPRGLRQPLFNLRAFAQEKDALFIVEAPIDAMSIEQSGGSCIALGGTSTAFFEKMLDYFRPECRFILAFDNDAPGRRIQERVKGILRNRSLPCRAVSHPAFKRYKDANAILMANPGLLKTAVDSEIQASKSLSAPHRPLDEAKAAPPCPAGRKPQRRSNRARHRAPEMEIG